MRWLHGPLRRFCKLLPMESFQRRARGRHLRHRFVRIPIDELCRLRNCKVDGLFHHALSPRSVRRPNCASCHDLLETAVYHAFPCVRAACHAPSRNTVVPAKARWMRRFTRKHSCCNHWLDARDTRGGVLSLLNSHLSQNGLIFQQFCIDFLYGFSKLN